VDPPPPELSPPVAPPPLELFPAVDPPVTEPLPTGLSRLGVLTPEPDIPVGLSPEETGELPLNPPDLISVSPPPTTEPDDKPSLVMADAALVGSGTDDAVASDVGCGCGSGDGVEADSRVGAAAGGSGAVVPGASAGPGSGAIAGAAGAGAAAIETGAGGGVVGAAGIPSDTRTLGRTLVMTADNVPTATCGACFR
jgi:hypothetical protein